MSDQQNTPLDDAAEHTAEAIEETAAAVDEVVEEVVEEVATPVEEATAAAQEAAAEAAEVIEGAVEDAVEGATDVPNDMVNDVYDQVMNRLRADGHIPSAPLVEEVAGDAIDMGEDMMETAVEAPEVVAAEADAIVRDTITPRREHWYTRPRRFLGRDW